MTNSTPVLPDVARPDAGVATFSEWTVGTPERQHAVLDAAMDAWTHLSRPDGMLSYTCLLSTDGSTLRHHTQWTDDDARSRFWSAETPETAPTRLADSKVERVRTFDEVVPGIERDGLGVYDLYRSHIAAGPAPETGCVVIVTIDFDGSDRDRQAQWIDAVIAALDAGAEPTPGLIAAHFYRSLDGTQVVNYAEWISEQAHRYAVDHGPDGIAQTDLPEWRRVREFPGVADNTNIKRYREHRSLPAPASSPT